MIPCLLRKLKFGLIPIRFAQTAVVILLTTMMSEADVFVVPSVVHGIARMESRYSWMTASLIKSIVSSFFVASATIFG